MVDQPGSDLDVAVIAVFTSVPQPPLADISVRALPRLLAARVRQRLVPQGLTVRQVHDALPQDARPTATGRVGVAAERQALGVTRTALDALVSAGLLLRRRARLRFTLNTKGSRLVEVDVYRLA